MEIESSIRDMGEVDKTDFHEGKTVKCSVFFITCNPNTSKRRITQREFDEAKEKFIRFIDYIFSKEKIGLFIENMGKGDIQKIKSDTAIETGKERGFCHSHTLIKVVHESKVRFDLAKMRAFANKYFGKKVHISCQGYGNAIFDLARYIGSAR